MKHHNNIEIILISKQGSTHTGQKALVKWLATILQFAIDKQQENIENMFPRILEDEPAIYLS